jgi:hypothetical protein
MMRWMMTLSILLSLVALAAGCGGGDDNGGGFMGEGFRPVEEAGDSEQPRDAATSDPALAEEVRALRKELESLRNEVAAGSDTRRIETLAEEVADLKDQVEALSSAAGRAPPVGPASAGTGEGLDQRIVDRIVADLADLRAKLLALSYRVGDQKEPDFRTK